MRDVVFTIGFTAIAVGICMIAGASAGLTVLVGGVVVTVVATDIKQKPLVSNNYYMGGNQ